MNNEQLEKKVRQDAGKVKKDLSTLVGDSSARINRMEENVSQVAGNARDELTEWVEDGVSQLSNELGKITGDARESVVVAAATVKKDVGHGLNQYNAKVQDVADRVPGGFSSKVVRYPWVAMSIALALGFLLGSLRNPVRQPLA